MFTVKNLTASRTVSQYGNFAPRQSKTFYRSHPGYDEKLEFFSSRPNIYLVILDGTEHKMEGKAPLFRLLRGVEKQVGTVGSLNKVPEVTKEEPVEPEVPSEPEQPDEPVEEINEETPVEEKAVEPEAEVSEPEAKGEDDKPEEKMTKPKPRRRRKLESEEIEE